MKNHLYNMFSIIKNGQLVKRKFVIIENSKVSRSFLNILWDEGYIIGYKNLIFKNSKKLKVFLKYKNGNPVINSINLISKPSRRVYYSIKQIWKLNFNNVFFVFSTNKGLKSFTECRKLKVGGEPFIIIN